MDVSGSVALVTGANRGLGRVLASQLLERGATTVYAAARDPQSITDERLVPVALDVTDPDSVRRAAQACGDVTLLINNAGRAGAGSLLTADLGAVRGELDTNFLGPLLVTRAFAPVLARNGGGAVVNVLSVLSWLAAPLHGSYAATKAAAWSSTNSVRAELRGQGTQVVGVHVGYMDTDMTAGLDVPKVPPAGVAAQILDAVAAGEDEVLADDLTRGVKQLLSGPPAALAPSR
ncbi:SDR family oxidoreductase [Pseudonocardia lutea]|jgi:NAD(P)-dependent dehydrogenase (short-subunit alcohol dehydrogenase family)|uniref:SDR family oxidoreductase n=1 Tax=Pseudonocardia lutea TaxID=2172015 RepID=A0ABW1IBX1_9PSEU